MLQMLTKFICSMLMAFIGLFVVKKISKSEKSYINIQNIFWFLGLIILPMIAYLIKYSYIYSILIYIVTIITYKKILSINYLKSTFSCAILYVTMVILDFITTCSLSLFFSADQIRSTWYVNIGVNIVFSIALIYIYYYSKIGNKLSDFMDNIESKKITRIIYFFILIILSMTIVLYFVCENLKFNNNFLTNCLLFFVLLALVIILFTERNSYDKLSLEYDNLFNYIKVFEEWIEQEQFIRHEYKNQLAVLRNLTKEKKVQNKIDSIILETINIDNKQINELKNMGNDSLKGLFYYKIVIARNQKININIEVNDKSNKILKKLNEDQIKALSKIIGVYLDNAIEASVETKKKIVYIEIYTIDNDLKIVISNTFKNKIDTNIINKKGFSTKGNNRGNGLYFAKNLISRNDWISQKQEIKDEFYIQTINIKI